MTISTHNGSTAHRAHNIRAEYVVSKQDHIEYKGHYEIWHDEKPRDAYERIFGDYVKEYNEGQKRSDRKITDYYKDVCNDKKKNPVYEMIVAIGNKENSLPEKENRQILHEFMYGNEDIGFKSWEERNPNLEVIGAYYHADEEGVPHLHIDYVPVAHGYKRGMWAQNGLDKAFREMGYEHESTKATPQIKWEKHENRQLEELCRWHGIEVEHPMAAKGVKHVHTELYKAKVEYNKAIEGYKAEIKDLEVIEENMNDSLEQMQDSVNESGYLWQDIMREIDHSKELLDSLNKEINNKTLEIQGLEGQLKELHELQDKVNDLENQYQNLSQAYQRVYKLEHSKIMIDSADLFSGFDKYLKNRKSQEQDHDYGHER